MLKLIILKFKMQQVGPNEQFKDYIRDYFLF